MKEFEKLAIRREIDAFKNEEQSAKTTIFTIEGYLNGTQEIRNGQFIPK